MTTPKRRGLLMTTLGLATATLLFVFGSWGYNFSRIPVLFRLNKQCQEEGYYMAEFEFQMLGFAYYLDKGHYVKAVDGISKLHKKLKTREGLIKVPKFEDKKEELEFYRNLQNPGTGAFMNDSFPYCTYEGPTGNVLLHMERLANESGEPLRLKYPLRFFDEINTPEKLKAYLHDIAYIGPLAAKLPESTFHMVRDLISYTRDDEVVYRHNLYSFPPEWKQALLEWFYENQDPETGYWGPRSRSDGKLLKLDLHNTASIVKSFADNRGNDLNASFPLRYKDEMFESTLKVMSEPPPDEGDLDEWHGWTLKMGKGIALLTRYLWKDASAENKARARETFTHFITFRFKNYYLPDQGGFSFYPGSGEATLDGTGGGIGSMERVGALSTEKQRRLWGGLEETCRSLGEQTVSELTDENVRDLLAAEDINSWRFYVGLPDTGNGILSSVLGIHYPHTTPVLDIVELVPKVKNWAESTQQSLGNWVSREEIIQEISSCGIRPVPVTRGAVPLETLNKILNDNGSLFVMGFDVLQVPRRLIAFRTGVL